MHGRRDCCLPKRRRKTGEKRNEYLETRIPGGKLEMNLKHNVYKILC